MNIVNRSIMISYIENTNIYIKPILYFLLINFILSHCYVLWIFMKKNFGFRIRPDEKKLIIITGATSGFGLMMSKHFFKLGFSVAAAYVNDRESGFNELENLAKDSKTKNHLFLVYMDVSSQKSIKDASNKIEVLMDQFNMKLFTLINNAGIATDGPFEFSKPDSTTKVVETNLNGTLLVTRQFIDKIIKNKGRVVNVSSGLSYLKFRTTSVYASTKSAVAQFSDILHLDIKPYGASSRCVLPGNLIASTSIMYTRLKCLKESIKAMSPEERITYKSKIQSYTNELKFHVYEATKNSNSTPEQIKATYGLEDDDLNGKNTWSSIFFKITSIIDGSIGRQKLEKSYVIQAFDDAVRLIYCPSHLHAGNYIYSNYVGPLFDIGSYEKFYLMSKFI